MSFDKNEIPQTLQSTKIQICPWCEFSLVTNRERVDFDFRRTALDQVLTASRHLLEIALSNTLRVNDPAYRANSLYEASSTLVSTDLLRSIDLLRFRKHRERNYFIQWSSWYAGLIEASAQKEFLSSSEVSSTQKEMMQQLLAYE